MGEIAETLGALAENVCEGFGTALLITTSVFSLISHLSSGTDENSNELQRDFEEADLEKNRALDTINNCRKSIQVSREIIIKYRYQQFCPNALKEIDDGVVCFEKMLDAKLYDEALCSAQKVAETARNYSNAVLLSEKAWTDGVNIWKAVRHMVNDKIQQLNSDESTLSLPSGEKIPFLLNKWTDENEIEEIKQAVSKEEPPKNWSLEQIQTNAQVVIDQLNHIITESTEYCIHTYRRGQRSRELIVIFKERGWKYKGFRYENDNPRRDIVLHFDSVTGDKLKAALDLGGGLKLTASVNSNNTNYKRIIVNNLVAMLQEKGVSVNQLEWD